MGINSNYNNNYNNPSPTPSQKKETKVDLKLEVPELKIPDFKPIDYSAKLEKQNNDIFVAESTGIAKVNLGLEDPSYNLFVNKDPSYIRTDLDVSLEDLDGIETDSKNDIKGKINGSIELDSDLFKDILKEYGDEAAGKAWAKTSFNYNPSKNEYTFKAYWDLDNWLFDFKPSAVTVKLKVVDGNKLKVSVGGAAGMLARAIDTKDLLNVLVDKLGDYGLKGKANSDVSATLEADFENSFFLEEIQIGKGNNIDVEKISADKSQLKFDVDQNGSFVVKFNQAEVIASSGTDKFVAKDKEGSDKITIKIDSKINNDLTTEINTETDISLNIKPEEKEKMKAKMKEFGLPAISADGKFELNDLKATVKSSFGDNLDISDIDKISSKTPTITEAKSESGSIKIDDLNIDVQGNKLKLKSATGDIKAKQDGSKTTFTTNNVDIKGSFKGSGADLNITKLNFSGDFIYDQNNPSEINFSTSGGRSLDFSGVVNKQVHIKGLKATNTDVKFDTKKSKVEIDSGENGQINLRQLDLPQRSNIMGLKLEGKIESEFGSGKTIIDAKSVSLSANFQDVSIKYLKAKGKMVYDNSGVSVDAKHIYISGSAGDFQFKKIQGSGKVKLSQNGDIELSKTKNLEIQTNIGLDLKGNLKASIKNGLYKVETIPEKPTIVNYKGPGGNVDLENAEFQGKMSFNESDKHLKIATHNDKYIKIENARIENATLENTSITNGDIDINLNNGSFELKPLPNKEISFESKINGIRIKDLKTNGNINFDSKNNSISWDKKVEFSLPDHAIDKVASDGPISFKISGNKVELDAKGSKLTAKFGDIELKDFEVNGKLIYDMKTQKVSFSGIDGDELSLSGKVNGKDIDVKASGNLDIKEDGNNLEITGNNVKVSGMLDGFTLESPEGASAKLVTNKQFTDIQLKDLKFDIKIDDIELTSDKGLFKTTETGYEINLSGNASAKKDKLFKLLDKFAKNDMLSSDIKKNIETTLSNLDEQLSNFGQTNINYKDIVVNLDQDFNLTSFNGESDATITDVELKAKIDKKEYKANIGDVTWSAKANSDGSNLNITEGDIQFAFDGEVKKQIVEQVKGELEELGFEGSKWAETFELKITDQTNIPEIEKQISDLGFELLKTETTLSIKSKSDIKTSRHIKKDLKGMGFEKTKSEKEIELEVSDDGEITINNAKFSKNITYKNKKGKEKVRDFSASGVKIAISTSIEDGNLKVSLDKLKTNNALASIAKSFIGGNKGIVDYAEDELKNQKIEYSREGKTLISIDLNDLIKNEMNEGINLESINLIDGFVKIDYTYKN